ncbi:MAG TPA: bifunctional riboflavin kinase/FAD synthetase [Anaerolineae bacterium]|nr:bifunctional riboflavin kinase/FAD synthetase [Anaerolineae bacterium]
MQHYRSLEGVHLQGAWLTIGAFDGVHLGHRAIIEPFVAEAHAAGAPAVVLTFFPHPSVVLQRQQRPFYLSTPEEKAELLGALGVDVVITHRFNRRVAALSARAFMERLKAHLGLRMLWVGYDFALGRNREGDIPTLKRLGEELGYQVHVMEAVTLNGEVISSSRIRTLLSAGQVEEAARLLGRPYQVTGKVVQGDGRGRQLGFPTANLKIWARRMVPGPGVYVAQARLADGGTWGAVVNVGVRPTFEAQPRAPWVEAHLLGFQGDLYGRCLTLAFLHRLREERPFPSPEALAEQIRRDVRRAEEMLAHVR